MAKKRKVKFWDAIAGSTEEELDEFVEVIKKRQKIWLILALIPFVNWFFAAFFIRSYNTTKVIASRGRKEPGGLIPLLIGIWAWLLGPFLIGLLLDKMPEAFDNNVVLGCGELLKKYHYVD